VHCAGLLEDAGKSDVKPGIEWLYGFERRWKSELTRRVAQPLPANRAYACNSRVVEDFFDKLLDIFNRLNLHTKPQNIFNVDETGFQTDIGSQKIFCKRGLKNPHKTVASSTKTMYTVQVCCSAIGNFLPLYVVYKGKHLYDLWCKGGPEDAVFNCSPSGWMESDQFVEWFEKVFVPAVSELEGGKLLLFDGHNSHISTRVVDIAVQNDIELLCLPAHTSSILQPLDVGVFKTVKGMWRKCLRDYYDKTRYSNVDKRAFPGLLKSVVDSGAFSRANAVTAFESCGIYPLNRFKIGDEKLSTSMPLIAETPSSGVPVEPAVEGTGSSNPKEVAPSSSGIANTISPRKGIEVALLTHLKQVTPSSTGQKSTRVKRTLAECLTSEEVSKRIRQAGAKTKNKTSLTKTNMKADEAKKKGKQKSNRSVPLADGKRTSAGAMQVKIRKPVWLQPQSDGATDSTTSVPGVKSLAAKATTIHEQGDLGQFSHFTKLQ